MQHATDCPFTFPATRKDADAIIMIQVCPCGYKATAWDGTRGVSK